MSNLHLHKLAPVQQPEAICLAPVAVPYRTAREGF